MNANQMLAISLSQAYQFAEDARTAEVELRQALGQLARGGRPTDILPSQVALKASEAQAKRNASALMCELIGATKEQIDCALMGDKGEVGELYRTLWVW